MQICAFAEISLHWIKRRRLAMYIYTLMGICACVFKCPADRNSLLRVPPPGSSTLLPPGSSTSLGLPPPRSSTPLGVPPPGPASGVPLLWEFHLLRVPPPCDFHLLGVPSPPPPPSSSSVLLPPPPRPPSSVWLHSHWDKVRGQRLGVPSSLVVCPVCFSFF